MYDRRIAVALLALAIPFSLAAQPGGRGGPPGPPPTAKAAAPEDLTGYWVSIVTEDWRFRMVTPPKGDYASVPLNPEGRRVADTWDPAKDEAAGEQCRSYGAPAIMRVPGRVHITWQDDNTLKVETDAGQQTRVFHFGSTEVPSGEQGWQGYSAATWEMAGGGRGRGPAPPRAGSLKVVTTFREPCAGSLFTRLPRVSVTGAGMNSHVALEMPCQSPPALRGVPKLNTRVCIPASVSSFNV